MMTALPLLDMSQPSETQPSSRLGYMNTTDVDVSLEMSVGTWHDSATSQG